MQSDLENVCMYVSGGTRTLPLVILMRHTFTKSLITQVPPKCVYFRHAEIVAKVS